MKMEENRILISNRQATRDFEIEKTYEAGIQLFGSEVKSIRAGKANLKGSFARIDNGQAMIFNMHINPYEFSREETDPVRTRKLLLHKAEIIQIDTKLKLKGYTLVPLKVYFSKRYVKVQIGLGKGRNLYDKRQEIKKGEAAREMKRALREKNR
jgi:SsrA-binding protein